MYTNLYTTDVVTSNQYNYHQHSLSTALASCTLTFTPPMWLLLIQLPSTPTIYNTGGVYTNLYTTDMVTSNTTIINTHYLHSTRGVYTNLYTTYVVTSNQYNHHQHPLSTTIPACTLTYTPLMWLLLIYTTTINTHYLQHSRRVH